VAVNMVPTSAPPSCIRREWLHCSWIFPDGALLAQLSPPAMTFPIPARPAHQRAAPGWDAPLDLTRPASPGIRPVGDVARFRCSGLDSKAMSEGGVAHAIYNAATRWLGRPFIKAPQIPFVHGFNAVGRIRRLIWAAGDVV